MDEKRCLQFSSVSRGRSAAIFFGRFGNGFSEMIWSGEQFLVVGAADFDAFFQVADGNARITDLVIPGMLEDSEQSDQPAMTPADDADSPRIERAIMLKHPVSRRLDVFCLQSAIFTLAPVVRAVAAAPTIVRRNDGVALLDQFTDDMRIFIAGNVSVNF